MWDLSSLTRDWTHVPCIGRQILKHWIYREVPDHSIPLVTFFFIPFGISNIWMIHIEPLEIFLFVYWFSFLFYLSYFFSSLWDISNPLGFPGSSAGEEDPELAECPTILCSDRVTGQPRLGARARGQSEGPHCLRRPWGATLGGRLSPQLEGQPGLEYQWLCHQTEELGLYFEGRRKTKTWRMGPTRTVCSLTQTWCQGSVTDRWPEALYLTDADGALSVTRSFSSC